MLPHRLLFKIAFQYPVLFVLTIIFGFSGALFNGISVTLLVPLILVLIGQEIPKMPGIPPVLQQIMDGGGAFEGDAQIAFMTALVFLAIVLKNLSGYVSTLVGTAFGQAVARSLRFDGVEVFLKVDIDYYSQTKTGDILNKINTEMSRTANAVKSLSGVVVQIITIFVFVVALSIISWQLTLIAAIMLSGVAFFNQFFVRRAKTIGTYLTESSRALTNKLIETLAGIRLIRTVATEENEAEQLKYLIKNREKQEFKSQANYAVIGPINEISGIISLLIIMVAGRYLFAQQLESISAILLTYLLLLFRLLPVVGQLNGSRSRLSNTAPSILVVADYLDRENKPFMKNGNVPFEQLKTGIRFESVSFGYGSTDELALKDIDLWIPCGKTVALVGTSGAGKSTLADLLPRFYDPTIGRITIDGENLQNFDLKSLRRRMGIVSQDTFLFNNSVRYNLTYGCPWAGEQEVIDAAKRANAYEFIMNLPQGFETDIGDRGVMLSGGQRQRLAIARALVRNPEILILDEATSALDTVSERLVQEAINELCHDRTTLVIAHRLSTIRKADCIVVMEQGRIIEVGPHEELLKREGAYARLYKAQFSEESEDAIQRARQETLINTSYEVRTRLNPMLGFLNLLVDDIVDSSEERQELTQEAYDAAVRLLKTLQFLENSAKSME